MKHIVIIGGGTGTNTLLTGLKNYPVKISVIVSTADDGGSSGRLRKDLGVLPPGDIRQCLIALAKNQKAKELFSYRFCEGSLKGHVVGNIFIAAQEKIFGDIRSAINESKKFLNARGDIFPVTLKPSFLSAKLADNTIIHGEHNIDEPSGHRKTKIFELRLSPKLQANPGAIRAIRRVDIIIFGPGDLFTSIIPNLLPSSMAKAINQSRAKKIFICNLMTKHGQTDGFKAVDHLKELEKYLGGKIDQIIINNRKPSPALLKKYREERAEFVKTELENFKDKSIKVIMRDVLSDGIIKKISGDALKRSFLRHDGKKLAKIIIRNEK